MCLVLTCRVRLVDLCELSSSLKAASAASPADVAAAAATGRLGRPPCRVRVRLAARVHKVQT